MPVFLDTRGRATLGIGLCDRCKRKMSLLELYPDPNTPGLKVCKEDLDVYDPWRLPARMPENISLMFVRPEDPIVIPTSFPVVPLPAQPPAYPVNNPPAITIPPTPPPAAPPAGPAPPPQYPPAVVNGSFLLFENGNYVLLEDGSYLIDGGSGYGIAATPPAPAAPPPPPPAPPSPAQPNISVRLTEASSVRDTEAGNPRMIN
jgi:hypothetical protein